MYDVRRSNFDLYIYYTVCLPTELNLQRLSNLYLFMVKMEHILLSNFIIIFPGKKKIESLSYAQSFGLPILGIMFFIRF